MKLNGVNRFLIFSCNKAYCTVCKVEVSPNPQEGCLHYWPQFNSLHFIPGYCPLYTLPPKGRHGYGFAADWDSPFNQNDCRMCCDIKSRYPEYDLFCQLGGIVGIMLGFSFLQLPELFGKVSSVSNYVLQSTKRKYCAH